MAAPGRASPGPSSAGEMMVSADTVKGQGAGRRSLVCEWVAAQLGHPVRFGLPTMRQPKCRRELIAPGQGWTSASLGGRLVFASRNFPCAGTQRDDAGFGGRGAANGCAGV